MENKRNIKRTAIIIASFIAVLGISIAGTYALLKSETQALTNTFKIGSVETEIIEEHFEFTNATQIHKDPKVKNVGLNDCYIRARISCPDEIALGSIGMNWEKNGDYYYYKGKVAPNEVTTSIFEYVNIPEGWVTIGSDGKAYATDDFKDFDVIVYQEAIVADIVGVESHSEAWRLYDSYAPSQTDDTGE